MAEHNVSLELFYDGVWNQAPAFSVVDPIEFRRGTTSFGNETDPAEGSATIYNGTGLYAPLSVVSGLYGKIGQNTPVRVSADSAVQITGEVSQWKPKRPVSGKPFTPIELSGVLRRIGRGNDPLQSPYTRAQLAAGPVDYWPLDEGRAALSGGNLITGGAAMVQRPNAPAVSFSGLDETFVPGGLVALPALNGGVLSATVRGTSTVSWRMEFLLGFPSGALAGYTSTALRSVLWTTGGGITTWWAEHGSDFMIIYGTSPYFPGLPFGATLRSSSEARFDDGRVHHVVLEVTQTNSTTVAYTAYIDGVVEDSGNNTTGALIGQQQIGAPKGWVINPDQKTEILTAGGVSVFSPKPPTAPSYSAVGGWNAETAADRMSRLGLEEGITVTIVGTASASVAMGPQQTIPLLDQFDEIAATDDASIFETKSALGLTMRTGVSKQNQTVALRLSRIGQVQPELEPVFGDTGIRNDVTARNPDGSARRVTQLTGPRNVQAPPTGVGRYTTSIDVNVSAESALADAAGWRVNLGTFDGTWYADVTVDLDMAPGLTSAVNAVDIGDLVEIAELPIEESLSSFRGIVIGIKNSLPAKRRIVTLYLIPEAPYRVGKLSITTGETDVYSGRLETDGSTVSGAVSAGAASFSVATPIGPLWTTTADDFPLDVVVGGQRVTVSGVVNYLNTNPYFESDAANWTPVNGAASVRSTAQFHEGTASLLITPNGTSAVPQVQSEEVQAVAGRNYTLSGWLRSTTAATRKLGLFWFNASHAFISANEISQALSAGVWTQYGPTTYTAPVGAAYLRIATNDPGTPASSATWFLDEATVIDGVTQTFIVKTTPNDYPIQYPIASGASAIVYQPIILAQ